MAVLCAMLLPSHMEPLTSLVGLHPDQATTLRAFGSAPAPNSREDNMNRGRLGWPPRLLEATDGATDWVNYIDGLRGVAVGVESLMRFIRGGRWSDWGPR